MTSTTRRRRTTIVIIAAVAVLALVAALVVFFVLPGLGTAAPAEAATPTVTEDGFEIELDGGVTITGSADVAPVGTEVRAELVEQDVPGGFGTFATPVAPVVDITLGDGLQPSAPITLAFTFTEDEVQALQADHLFVLGESDTEGREVDFVESVWDESTRTMTAELEHLSWYTVTQVDQESLTEQMGKWFNQQMSVRTAKPDCVDEPIAGSGSFVLANPWPDAAWVCASESADGVTVELQSNSGLVYEILSEPRGEYAPLGSVNPSGVLTALAAQYLDDALEGDSVLLPGGNMDITYDKPFESAYIELKIEPGLSQISTLTFGTSMLLPTKWAEKLDWASCGGSALESLTGSALAQTILGCVGAGVGGTASGLLGIIASGPGLLYTQIEGAVKEATRENVEGFTVSLVAADAIRELPAGATWLFEHSTGGTSTSGEEEIATLPADGDAAASYPFSTNQWVSCNDTPAEGHYALDGKWTSLSYILALQEHAPEGMTAAMEILGDGKVLFSGTVTRESPAARAVLDVTGVQELTVTAITDDGCGAANKGYGTLVQAYLETTVGMDASEASGFLGTWTGPIDQAGAGPYSVVLTLEENESGVLAGRVRYPELDNCSGYLTDFELTGDVLATTEHITMGGRCVEVVPLELTLDGDQLRYQGVGRELEGVLDRE